jgi:hypothetical protein
MASQRILSTTSPTCAARARPAGIRGQTVASALAQQIWPEALNSSADDYILTWTAIAILSAGLIATEAVGRARRAHGGMAEAMLSGTLHHMLPALVVGAVITFILARIAPSALWLLPGLWQMLIALAVFAAQPMLPPAARLVGIWYLASGTVCMTVATGAAPLSPWLMGLPFLIGQLAMAAIIHRAGRHGHG